MNEYVIEIGGIEHTVLLTDEDAKRLAAKAVKTVKTVDEKAAPTPLNKGRNAASAKDS